MIKSETQYLLGFACGHAFHLACLLQDFTNRQSNQETPNGPSKEGIPEALAQMAAGETANMNTQLMNYDRSVGPKVDRAALLRMLISDGCPVSGHVKEG